MQEMRTNQVKTRSHVLTMAPCLVLTLLVAAYMTTIGNVTAQEGAVEVETLTVPSASVLAINYPSRTLTLVMPNGSKNTYKISSDVKNFDQIEVGDKVNATLVEALAVYMGGPGATPNTSDVKTVSLAPKGAKPGVIVADTQEVTAKIVSVDPKERKVTLQTADGENRTVRVSKSVDLAKVKPGNDVTVRMTEALAIVVEKP
jgi:translation initiation factor IF-1